MEHLTITEFYRDRSVFITGATGFIGKVLVEKLLRSCPDVERIYILMRPLKEKTAACRLQEFTENKIFDDVRYQQPGAMEKIVSIEGDVILPGFGISPENLELLVENVSIVFNSAARIKFNEKLKTAIDMNVKGPLELLEICRLMKRLEALVHVSTAFNNLDREEIKEEVIHSIANPEKLIGLVDCLNGNVINKIENEIIGNCPNTYTYTKGLAEQLLEQRRNGLPLAIVRPSIVTAALNEPVPGWVDNWNGTTGTIAAIGTGFIRVAKLKEEMVADIIPVDFSVNLMIAVAWHMANTRPNRVPVYSSTTGQFNPITWGFLTKLITEFWLRFPPYHLFWYPSLLGLTTETALFILKFMFHYLPASVIDFVYLLRGKPTKWVRLYRKAHRALAVSEFFTTNQWRFLSSNPIRLLDEMSPQDRKIFCFDVRQIDWKNYFESYIIGVRRFILKENPKSIPIARVKLTRFFVGRWLLNSILFFSLLYFFNNYMLVFFFVGTLLIASKFRDLLHKGQSLRVETDPMKK